MSSWGSLRPRVLARRHALVALTVLCVLSVSALALVTSAGARLSSHYVRIESAARFPLGGHALGRVATSATQRGQVVLKPRDPAALAAFVAAVNDRHSPLYRHYLAPGQFAARFGPSSATLRAVRTQLQAVGLHTGRLSANHLLLSFSASTARVEAAFHTQLARYRSRFGTTGQLATRALALPASISSDVTSVIGLDTLIKPHAAAIHPPTSAYQGRVHATPAKIASHPAGAPQPCAAATTAANTYGGLTDDQIANAYGAFGLYGAKDTGQGVHVGVYELEPFSTSDLKTFDECYFGTSTGDAMAASVKTVPVDGGLPAGPGSGEAILDVEDVSAMAPGASIDVYEAPNSTAGALDEYAAMVNNDTDKIISSSWGECEQDLQQYSPGIQQAENLIFEQAAAQGQTVLSAAGDTGNDDCNAIRSTPPPTDQNPLSVDDPSAQPYVLAVGGTTIQDADPAHYEETVWNDGAVWGGGGGGLSASWGAPAWQQFAPGFPEPGSVTDNTANKIETDAQNLGVSNQNWPPGFCANNANLDPTGAAIPCRSLPDVSAQADEFTGAVTIYQAPYGFFTIGGTSSATPIWAGLMALVDASPACQTNGVKASAGVGFLSPLLYAVGANPAEYANAFHDITVGNNDVYGFDNGQAFPAQSGYDLATGLGSPILTHSDGTTPGLADDLCALAGKNSTLPKVSSLSATSGPVAGNNTVTLTGTGFAAGDKVTVGSLVVTPSKVDLSHPKAETITLTMPKASLTQPTPTTQTTDPATGVTYPTGGSTGVQDGAGPVNLTVSDPSSGASSQVGAQAQYDYVDESATSTPVPAVSSVSPYAGLEAGGSTVTIYGSGFSSGDTVTIGGVAATNVTIVHPWELTATVPAFVATHTGCVTAAAISQETGDANPAADDICQTDVVVSNANGPSAVDDPFTAYEGPYPATDQDGVPEVPPGFELSPQPTEFDYVPAPTVTSVTDENGNAFSTASPATLADANGGTVAIVHGTGLNDLTLNFFLVGDPTQDTSVDVSVLSSTGTQAVIVLPKTATVANGGTQGPAPESDPVNADTLGGTSTNTTQDVIYSGVPVISGVSTSTTDPTLGIPAAPDTGGVQKDTVLTVNGQGFSDVVGPLEFIDAYTPYSSATQYQYTVASDSEIDTHTVAQNPAFVDTQACTTSGCSATSSADQVILYPPGAPVITSITPTSGPAAGGTSVTITGENLGCVTSVTFGTTAAVDITPTAAILDCGSTSSLTVTAPAGTANSTVPVTLTTVESEVTGDPAATLAHAYTYTANGSSTPPAGGGSTPTGTGTTPASPPPGPTTTVTTPGTTTTVITPGTTTTVTTPGTTTTGTSTTGTLPQGSPPPGTQKQVCTTSYRTVTRAVKVRVKVKVHRHGHVVTRTVTRIEKKHVRVRVRHCTLVSA